MDHFCIWRQTIDAHKLAPHYVSKNGLNGINGLLGRREKKKKEEEKKYGKNSVVMFLITNRGSK